MTSAATAQTSSFNHQRKLIEGGCQSTANYDFEFRLFDAGDPLFEQNAASAGNESLQQELRNAGARLVELGLERL